jgi:ABC-type dipeptide/oligopeptide/nickel transport system ATPase component
MDEGQIVEVNKPKEFFSHPQHERTRLFLKQILHLAGDSGALQPPVGEQPS